VSAGSITGTFPGGKARLAVGAIQLATRAPQVESDVGVVQHLLVATAELDATHVARGTRRDRQHEGAESVVFSGTQRVDLLAGEHEVGRAELPAAGKHRWRWRARRVARGRAVRGPGGDGGDLVVAQAALVQELAVTGLGEPRRHAALQHGGRDRLCAPRHRSVVEHAERRARDA
jgi:hypothetical protein